jgi:hypothetical protein
MEPFLPIQTGMIMQFHALQHIISSNKTPVLLWLPQVPPPNTSESSSRCWVYRYTNWPPFWTKSSAGYICNNQNQKVWWFKCWYCLWDREKSACKK